MQIEADDSKLTVVCKICRRQLSRYTCPACNLPYCSLICFRSPAHSGCSESFYKKELENGIKTQTSKNAEERLKMMEILKRFEESNLDDGLGDEDDDDDLEARFEDIDIANADSETLWNRLSEEEKNRFMKAINDPNSELAKQLLSEAALNSGMKPWWEAPEQSPDIIGAGFGQKPEPLQVPLSMVKALPSGPPLIYNLCAICIAYAFTTRHLAASPLKDAPSQDVKSLIARLVPFLTDRKATTLYTDVSTVITSLWSRFNTDEISNDTMSALLHDTAILMRPRPVSVMHSSVPGSYVDIMSHPHRNLVLVLSDLHHVYGGTAKPTHVAHKLLFYASHALSTPSPVLNSLATDLHSRAITKDRDGSLFGSNAVLERREVAASGEAPRKLVEEI